MSASFESTQRFLRPADVARLRRNHRRVQMQRVLLVARNVILVTLVLLTASWLYHRTQSDARFAVKHIEVAGAIHTSSADIGRVTARYIGLNLFQIDIARVRADLGSLPWVRRIDIEKKLPDTLRIDITERQPVALVQVRDRLLYVDGNGAPFADLSATVGDPDLPLISGATSAEEITRTVAFIGAVRARDRPAFGRISEIRPIPPRGFALFDRHLSAFIYVNDADLSPKWRQLDSIARAEGLGPAAIEYADLRFNDRIIIKPIRPIVSAGQQHPVAQAVITN